MKDGSYVLKIVLLGYGAKFVDIDDMKNATDERIFSAQKTQRIPELGIIHCLFILRDIHKHGFNLGFFILVTWSIIKLIEFFCLFELPWVE